MTTSPHASPDDRIAALEREKTQLQERLRDAEQSLARVRAAYLSALEQLQLQRRRVFVASAERGGDDGAQLAFDAVFEQVRKLSQQLDEANAKAGQDQDDAPADKGDNPRGGKKGDKPSPRGRRELADTDLPVERVEIVDPALEGVAERITFEESSRLGYRRGGPCRIVIARAVYKVAEPITRNDRGAQPSSETAAQLVTAAMPPETFRRSLLAPSMVAHVMVNKYLLGVPFYRQEQSFALRGFSLDRGTMSRYAEDSGATLGAIVEAARRDAFEHAFCLSTDATGVRIQPGPLDERGGRRGPCHKGHFFVVLADRDHVFFEYQEKHTSAAVCAMFKGFKGYIQADAHAVYDALFAGRAPRGETRDPTEGPPPKEVGCWSHCRRGFWEAAVCKHEVGVQGLKRIDAIFAADRALADLPPSRRKERRETLVRPHVDAFFAWVDAERTVSRARGLVSSALGYAANQHSALRHFLEDGRLRLDNNGSERALRPIASARRAWLFFGSDDHAQAAANLFSLVASCKLHGIDPESYLTEVIRVLPHWPRDRYLELTPLRWGQTRARLDPSQLDAEYGPLTVPPAGTTEEPPTSG